MKPRTTLLVCALILLVAAGVTTVIYFTEPTAGRSDATRRTAMLVEVTEVKRGSYRPAILALGTVEASLDISLRPQVSGEIVERSPSFVPGGFVEKGEMVLRIDSSDYLNELEQRQSEFRQAQVDFTLEMGRQNVAEQDYALLAENLAPEQEALVLREPQLTAARARVEFARAAVDRAETDLKRTEIRAPFDAHIISRSVNEGSHVAPGDDLGRLVGRELYWVATTVPISKLRWIDFPSEAEPEGGSNVRIRDRTAWPEGSFRTGYVDQLIGALEDDTRMARVLVAVPDPLSYRSGASDQPGLMIGGFVETQIEGKELTDVIRLSRDYVRGENSAWVMEDGKLSIRKLGILVQDAEYAYVDTGLKDGDRVVTTNLSTPTDGAPLRLEGDDSPAEASRNDERQDDSVPQQIQGGNG